MKGFQIEKQGFILKYRSEVIVRLIRSPGINYPVFIMMVKVHYK